MTKQNWWWKLPLRITEGIVACLSLYFTLAIIGMALPSGRKYVKEDEGVTIYLRSDGIHTDFVLPVKSSVKDWSSDLLYTNVNVPDSTRDWVSFGWGDKNFFLKTPSWNDLTFATAITALSYTGESAIHNVFLFQPQKSPECKELTISVSQYSKLVQFIERSYVRNKKRGVELIKGGAYWDNDAFYESSGTYGAFTTCNTWISNGLKEAGLPSCLWTPFSLGIMTRYDQVN